jgi:branched-subunit amino acid transport protein
VSDTWVTILALTIATAAIRASGPVILGGRELHPLAFRTVALLAPALLAALIAIDTFTDPEGNLELEAPAAGLAAAAGVLVWNRRAMLAAVAAAAVTAAAVRAVT